MEISFSIAISFQSANTRSINSVSPQISNYSRVVKETG
jgi:hypothetical protein